MQELMEARGMNAAELISQAGLASELRTSTMVPISQREGEDSGMLVQGRPSSVAESRSQDERVSDDEDVLIGASVESHSDSSRRGSSSSRRGGSLRVGRDYMDAPEAYRSNVTSERTDSSSRALSIVHSSQSKGEDEEEG